MTQPNHKELAHQQSPKAAFATALHILQKPSAGLYWPDYREDNDPRETRATPFHSSMPYLLKACEDNTVREKMVELGNALLSANRRSRCPILLMALGNSLVTTSTQHGVGINRPVTNVIGHIFMGEAFHQMEDDEHAHLEFREVEHIMADCKTEGERLIALTHQALLRAGDTGLHSSGVLGTMLPQELLRERKPEPALNPRRRMSTTIRHVFGLRFRGSGPDVI